MIYLSADSYIWLVTRDSKVHFTPAQLFDPTHVIWTQA